MHHMEADKVHKEKGRWEMHKNVMSNIEQIMEAILNEQ